jgi:hypothetical protein
VFPCLYFVSAKLFENNIGFTINIDYRIRQQRRRDGDDGDVRQVDPGVRGSHAVAAGSEVLDHKRRCSRQTHRRLRQTHSRREERGNPRRSRSHS